MRPRPRRRLRNYWASYPSIVMSTLISFDKSKEPRPCHRTESTTCGSIFNLWRNYPFPSYTNFPKTRDKYCLTPLNERPPQDGYDRVTQPTDRLCSSSQR